MGVVHEGCDHLSSSVLISVACCMVAQAITIHKHSPTENATSQTLSSLQRDSVHLYNSRLHTPTQFWTLNQSGSWWSSVEPCPANQCSATQNSRHNQMYGDRRQHTHAHLQPVPRLVHVHEVGLQEHLHRCDLSHVLAVEAAAVGGRRR